MKVVVVGGSGLIGSQVVDLLSKAGQDVRAASRRTGVNTLTGEGLDAAVAGEDVVVDASDSPSFEAAAVREFFTRSTGNLLAAEAAAGVRHHVVVSMVGVDRNTENAYQRAKVAQEAMVRGSGIPYTILRATQFFEFLGAIANAATDGGTVRVAPVPFQPVAAADVARNLAELATGAPVNGVVELAGPERGQFDEVIRETLADRGDPRSVEADPDARYLGAPVKADSMVPNGDHRTGTIRLADWLARRG